MRVGNRTDFNRLRIAIETDGSISPREALEESISIMIQQLKSVVGFKEEVEEAEKEAGGDVIMGGTDEDSGKSEEERRADDILKTRIEDLNLSVRTLKALSAASIRTVGGLTRKKEDDLLEISGLGDKGVQEIKRALANYGIILK
jgi:DNA-directed RNA polymerase subunit alpha